MVTPVAPASPIAQPAKSPRTSLRRKLTLAAVVVCLFFALLEGVLAICGVETLSATDDPYVGFAPGFPLFEEQQQSTGQVVMQTTSAKLDYFNRQQFASPKPAGTYRVFCLGGSTTYGRPYDDATSFAGWLRELLPEVDRSQQWEVINAGGISYASYRVAAVMEELSQYQPDLFIVYTGHNEFLENRTYSELIADPPSQRKLVATLAKTRTFSALHRFLRPPPKLDGKRFELAGEVDAVLDHTVGPDSYHRDDELKDQIVEHFRFNLARMVQIARDADAEIVFVTPSSNLKDSSPFKSENRANISSKAKAKWNAAYDKGLSHAKDGRHKLALAAFTQAAAIDDQHANLHFEIGRTLFTQKRYPEATKAFRRAREEDVCPLRALTEMSTIVRDIAGNSDSPLVDFEAIVSGETLKTHGHNIPGRELFLDHVHPTIEGHKLLAVAIIERLAEQGIVGASSGWKNGVVPRVAKKVEASLFPERRAGALRNLAKVLNWAGKHDEAGRLALEALKILPDDPEALVIGGAYLKSQRRFDEAIRLLAKAIETRPQDVETRRLYADALFNAGNFESALDEYETLVAVDPDDLRARDSMGAALSRLERYAEAVEQFETVLKQGLNDANVHYNLGVAQSQLGQRAKAVFHLSEAIRLNSRDAEAHYELARIYVETKQIDKAGEHLRQALRYRPDFPEATQLQNSLAAPL